MPELKCLSAMQPAEARDDDEQIVFDHPLLMLLPEPVREVISRLARGKAVRKSPGSIMSCSAGITMLSCPWTWLLLIQKRKRTLHSILRRKLSTMSMRVLMMMTRLKSILGRH